MAICTGPASPDLYEAVVETLYTPRADGTGADPRSGVEEVRVAPEFAAVVVTLDTSITEDERAALAEQVTDNAPIRVQIEDRPEDCLDG
jgi:hypothetical protein